jgi:phosphoglycolate phosphatase-like HAD superfamily hydrolase
LHAAGLADLVPAQRVIGRDDAPPKPAPDGIWRLLRAFGLDPGEVWFVGDGLFDLRAARAAGVAAVWLDLDGTGAHAPFADLVVRDLLALVPSRRRTHLPNSSGPA